MRGKSTKLKSGTKNLSGFVRSLERELKRLDVLLHARVIVAVSGGADSTALLLALDQLLRAKRLSWNMLVAHLDHKLRSSSKEDAAWVTQLTQQLGYEAITKSTNVRLLASKNADNLEQAARKARYEFLTKVAKQERASLVITAHTLDDQAETVLLRLLRGSGAEGLAGIEPVRTLSTGSDILLCRPLLTWCRRQETERFCRTHKAEFRSDQMNTDERFTRVRVRKQLLPLMESFNQKIVETLARSAMLLREDSAVLSKQAEQLLRVASNGALPSIEAKSTSVAGGPKLVPPAEARRSQSPAPPLNVRVLAAAAPAIRRRALRQWVLTGVGSLRRLEMVHFLSIEGLLEGQGGRKAELPNGIRVRRQRDWLYLTVKRVEKDEVDL